MPKHDHSCLRSLPKNCKLRITLYNVVYLYKLHVIMECGNIMLH